MHEWTTAFEPRSGKSFYLWLLLLIEAGLGTSKGSQVMLVRFPVLQPQYSESISKCKIEYLLLNWIFHTGPYQILKSPNR